MGSSARNGPRVSSARRTRRTLPVHPADPTGNDQLAAPMTEPEPPAETTIATADRFFSGASSFSSASSTSSFGSSCAPGTTASLGSKCSGSGGC